MFGHCSAINSISEPFVRVFRWYAFPIYDFKSPFFCHFTISQNIKTIPNRYKPRCSCGDVRVVIAVGLKVSFTKRPLSRPYSPWWHWSWIIQLPSHASHGRTARVSILHCRCHARWTPTSYKWGYAVMHPKKWPYTWVIGVRTLSWLITLLLLTGRGPSCVYI